MATFPSWQLCDMFLGKDDPVCIILARAGLPAVRELLERSAFLYVVPGWMRSSQHGPFEPHWLPLEEMACTTMPR